MHQKAKRLASKKEIAAAKRAYDAVFRSSDTVDDPFQPQIEKRAIIFFHSYAVDEEYLQTIGKAALAIGDPSSAYISLIEGASREDFVNRFHWKIDLLEYPYDELEKDDDWFPLMENAIYSINGRWGIIFSEVGHALIGGPKQFFAVMEELIPGIDEEVYAFLKDLKNDILHGSIKSRKMIGSWLPTLMRKIYGARKAKEMLKEAGFENLFDIHQS